MTAPDGIGMIDMDTMMPMTNADTKVGMKVLVTMTPGARKLVGSGQKAV